MLKLKTREKPFPELSYANPRQPALTRWVIHSIEGLSGRDRYTALYDFWRRHVVPTGERVFSRMLDLIDVRVRTADQWPPAQLPDTPLVIVANHPFGIGDGIAVLSLAEQLGRPFRVMIHKDLLKIREMEPYSLPIDFSETKDALKNNMAVRHEAVRLLKRASPSWCFRPVASPPRRRALAVRATCHGRCFRHVSSKTPGRPSFRCIFPGRTAGCSILSAAR